MLRELVDGVWMLPFPVGNAYLWRLPGGLGLFDTGVAGSETAIIDYVRDLEAGPLRVIVLSHCHDDHRGSAAALRDATGATVAAHAADAPRCAWRGARPSAPADRARAGIFESVAGGVQPAPSCVVDIEVTGRERPAEWADAQIVAGPGDTSGSIALHLADRAVLLTGDCIASVRGQPILGPFNVDRAQARRTFRDLAALRPSVAAFGHGEPLVEHCAAALLEAAGQLPN